MPTAFALWPCASPAYLAEHGTPRTVQDLATHQVIFHTDRRSTWRFKAKSGAVHEVEIVPGVVVPEPAVVKTMLIRGAGIGQLPDFHASDAIANRTLVRVLADYEPDRVDAHALYTSHRSMSAKVRVFIDALVAA